MSMWIQVFCIRLHLLTSMNRTRRPAASHTVGGCFQPPDGIKARVTRRHPEHRWSLGAIQNIGGLGCLPFSPYACDLLGRRRTIFLGACIIVAGAIVQTASQSVNMFIGARFMGSLIYSSFVISRILIADSGFRLGFRWRWRTSPRHGDCLPRKFGFFSLKYSIQDAKKSRNRTQRAPLGSVYNALWPGGAFMCVLSAPFLPTRGAQPSEARHG